MDRGCSYGEGGMEGVAYFNFPGTERENLPERLYGEIWREEKVTWSPEIGCALGLMGSLGSHNRVKYTSKMRL